MWASVLSKNYRRMLNGRHQYNLLSKAYLYLIQNRRILSSHPLAFKMDRIHSLLAQQGATTLVLTQSCQIMRSLPILTPKSRNSRSKSPTRSRLLRRWSNWMKRSFSRHQEFSQDWNRSNLKTRKNTSRSRILTKQWSRISGSIQSLSRREPLDSLRIPSTWPSLDQGVVPEMTKQVLTKQSPSTSSTRIRAINRHPLFRKLLSLRAPNSAWDDSK